MFDLFDFRIRSIGGYLLTSECAFGFDKNNEFIEELSNHKSFERVLGLSACCMYYAVNTENRTGVSYVFTVL
jgi:hypothetical protein